MINHLLENYATSQILPVHGICEHITAFIIAFMAAVVWSWVVQILAWIVQIFKEWSVIRLCFRRQKELHAAGKVSELLLDFDRFARVLRFWR